MLKNFFNIKQKSLFIIHDPAGAKLLSKLRLTFRHLNDHIFCHSVKDAVNPMCGSETETTDHFFLLCQFFGINTQKLFNALLKTNPL